MNAFRYPMRSRGLPKPDRRPSSRSSPTRACGSDCQTRSDSGLRASSCCQRRSDPTPPSLSCRAVTPRRRRDGEADAHRLEVHVVGHAQVTLPEPPRRLLAQHAGRLAAGVALDDAALDLEVAARQGERGRVQPERVTVLRDHCRRCTARDVVEPLRSRLSAARPVAAAPAVAADDRARLPRCVAYPGERLVERAAAVERDLHPRQRPGGKVHVGVVETRDDDPPAEVDDLR